MPTTCVSALEQRLNDSLMDAWVALEQQQFTLEQDIEFLSEEETPTDVADSMAYVEQGLRDDPQLEAFAHQLATLQVELLEAQVDDPNEAEVIRRKVALLVEKQESRRQALKSELEAEFEAMANKRRSNQLEVARAQLERVNARQKALREKLSARTRQIAIPHRPLPILTISDADSKWTRSFSERSTVALARLRSSVTNRHGSRRPIRPVWPAPPIVAARWLESRCWLRP